MVKPHRMTANDIRVHTSDMRMTYEYITVVNTDDIRVHATDIRILYG